MTRIDLLLIGGPLATITSLVVLGGIIADPTLLGRFRGWCPVIAAILTSAAVAGCLAIYVAGILVGEGP